MLRGAMPIALRWLLTRYVHALDSGLLALAWHREWLVEPCRLLELAFVQTFVAS